MSEIESREQLIQDAFGGKAKLQTRGDNFWIKSNLYGQVVIIPMKSKGHLVAAEKPPATFLPASSAVRCLSRLPQARIRASGPPGAAV